IVRCIKLRSDRVHLLQKRPSGVDTSVLVVDEQTDRKGILRVQFRRLSDDRSRGIGGVAPADENLISAVSIGVKNLTGTVVIVHLGAGGEIPGENSAAYEEKDDQNWESPAQGSPPAKG